MKFYKYHKNAQLFLYLPNEDSQPILWRLVSFSEVIKCGCIVAEEVDSQLSDLSSRYLTWVLVPASEITFHQVTLPRHSGFNRLKMLPFILEENLASDIGDLHFAVLHQHGDICNVAVVEKSVMSNWLKRCKQHGIRDHMFLPDVLMLPLASEGWSGVYSNNQWLFRRDKYAGMAVEPSWLPQLLAISSPAVIECYSVPPVHCMDVEWKKHPERDVLQLAAENNVYPKADLRQGEFSRNKLSYTDIYSWRLAIISFMIFLLLLFTNAGIKHYKLWQQMRHWQQASVHLYQQIFPEENNVIDPRSQMQKHLVQLSRNNQTTIRVIMQQLQQLLTEVATIQLQTLTWDSKRRELRLVITTTSFKELEKFKQLSGGQYHLKSGEIKRTPYGIESQVILGVKDD